MALKPEDVAFQRTVGGRRTNVSKAAAAKERRARAEWKKKNATTYTLTLFHSTDGDLVEKLAQVDNRAGYIKSLIRADIERECEEKD